MNVDKKKAFFLKKKIKGLAGFKTFATFALAIERGCLKTKEWCGSSVG